MTSLSLVAVLPPSPESRTESWPRFARTGAVDARPGTGLAAAAVVVVVVVGGVGLRRGARTAADDKADDEDEDIVTSTPLLLHIAAAPEAPAAAAAAGAAGAAAAVLRTAMCFWACPISTCDTWLAKRREHSVSCVDISVGE